jgi:biopolymer transport protein ExbB
MEFLYTLVQQLGILEIPLLLCSMIVCIVGIERLVVLLRYTFSLTLDEAGNALIKKHSLAQETQRANAACFWLCQQKKMLSSGLRLLHLVAVIAPLLGLLGTVLGLVQAFDNIGRQAGPVEVSMLAEGLGVAMSTTAVGLLIAVPALVLSHLYQLWIDTIIDRLEYSMNARHLSLGVTVDAHDNTSSHNTELQTS